MAIFGIPLWRRKRGSIVTQVTITEPADLPELTPEEIKNGWTLRTKLTAVSPAEAVR